jgi:hypothetical protein
MVFTTQLSPQRLFVQKSRVTIYQTHRDAINQVISMINSSLGPAWTSVCAIMSKLGINHADRLIDNIFANSISSSQEFYQGQRSSVMFITVTVPIPTPIPTLAPIPTLVPLPTPTLTPFPLTPHPPISIPIPSFVPSPLARAFYPLPYPNINKRRICP